MISTIRYDEELDDYVLDLPDELIKSWGITEHTELQWEVKDGKVYLTKISS